MAPVNSLNSAYVHATAKRNLLKASKTNMNSIEKHCISKHATVKRLKVRFTCRAMKYSTCNRMEFVPQSF